MSFENIKPGDLIDVDSDAGKVINAPWRQELSKIEDGKFWFQEWGGESGLIGYELDAENYDGLVEKDGKTIHCFKK